MTDQITQGQINQTAWAACDTFRGVVDAGQYKDYILVMLFLKYISDLWNDHVETYRQQFGGDDAMQAHHWHDWATLPHAALHPGPETHATPSFSTGQMYVPRREITR